MSGSKTLRVQKILGPKMYGKPITFSRPIKFLPNNILDIKNDFACEKILGTKKTDTENFEWHKFAAKSY